MKVLGISGLPGSGKSLVSKIAREKGISSFNMGDLVREESKKRNTDVGKTAIYLRKKYCDYVLAKLVMKKIMKQSSTMNTKETILLIEGIRSQYEAKMFKESFNDFRLLSVFSSPKTRFMRLKDRNRKDDSADYEEFMERDQRELEFGIGNVIATSDYIIVNDSRLEEYESHIHDFFDKFLR